MTRLPSTTLWAALLCAALVGCLPTTPKPPEAADLAMPPVPDLADPTIDVEGAISARSFFTREILPFMALKSSDTLCKTLFPKTEDQESRCQNKCGLCHKVDGGIGPAFLKSADPPDSTYNPYPTMATWTSTGGPFITKDPEASQLLRKGQHEGPALLGTDLGCTEECGKVLKWLTLERAERDAIEKNPNNPAVKPFYPNFDGAVNSGFTTVNVVAQAADPLSIDSRFDGVTVRFKAAFLPGNRGIEVQDLRVFNVIPNPTGPKQQRTIRMQRLLFVVWKNGSPLPDPTDNFANTERSIRAFADDNDPMGLTRDTPGQGNLIIPGRFTLSDFRPGSALSIVWNDLSVLPPVAGENPCNPAGLNIHNDATNGVAKFIKLNTCAQAGNCHDSKSAGGIDMTPIYGTDAAKKATLCETLKYYRDNKVLEHNPDPAAGDHPYRLTDANCTTAGLGNGCFTAFKSVLANWLSVDP